MQTTRTSQPGTVSPAPSDQPSRSHFAPQPSAKQPIEWIADALANQLREPRDVREAWSAWTPELTYGRHAMPPPPDARQAAVLILLYWDGQLWRVPLMERCADDTVHSRQISFPGGRTEPGETPEETACREFEEELGASRSSLRVCGRLTPLYIYASNFYVVPCVGFAESPPEFTPNPEEVANLLPAPVVQLASPQARGISEIRRRGLVFQAPHIEYEGRRIWGATSMMLGELFQVLRRQGWDLE